MPYKFILPIVTLLAVAGSGTFYLATRNQMRIVENKLKLSRDTLQEKILEAMELESQIATAREENTLQQHSAEEVAAKALHLEQRVESLSKKIAQAGSIQDSQSEEIRKLGEINRKLSQQINTLRANAAPPGWQERLAQLQSQVLDLQTQNASLPNDITNDPSLHNDLPQALPSNPTTISQPIGEIIRVGPGASFVVLNYGRSKGAAEGQSLTLTRDQRIVGAAHLTHTTEDFSIAQILTPSNNGDNLNVPDIHSGDKAHVQ